MHLPEKQYVPPVLTTFLGACSSSSLKQRRNASELTNATWSLSPFLWTRHRESDDGSHCEESFASKVSVIPGSVDRHTVLDERTVVSP